MQEKIYTMKHLECANCAARMEAKFNALPEVASASIVFATRQLRLTAEDPDSLIEKLTRIARTVEGEVEILPRAPEGYRHGHCSCGHHHEHEHDHCDCGHHHEHGGCDCGHSHDHGEKHREGGNRSILPGVALFGAGLALSAGGLKGAALAAFGGAYLILAWEIIAGAVKSLVKGHMLDENFLMTIASLGAFAIGEYAEAVGVILFYRVGEYFEEKAVERSRSQIMEAVDLRPEAVNLWRAGEIQVIPAAQAKAGDLLLVRPGDRIPLDGTVMEGESRVDTAPITGEPVPRGVGVGDPVISGCINTTGQLIIRVERELSESMVTRILNCVENAAASKPKCERFITRFARIYTPLVVGTAVLVAVVPSLITGDWNYWVYTALSFLVMSCPCALVLSVPLAFFSGIGAGSRRGILFKGGASMEAMGRIRAVAMDKTGTLTQGNFQVREIRGNENLLALAASCECHSTHPIAASIMDAARERGITVTPPEKLEEIPGRGIRAVIDGKRVLCGSERLLREQGIDLPEGLDGAGTWVLLAQEGKYLGCLIISDTLKPGAREAVARLKARGMTAVMLTGDNEEAARQIGAETGIDQVHGRLLPDEKLARLGDIRRRYGAVMFVGDGVNDAPVLAGADVGAAMGSGADAAIEAADVVFMTSDVQAIPEALDIARRTARIAWQNVVFALGVKLLVMVLGLLGYASMWMAVFADSGVAMLCVLNSIRLLYRKA